MNKVILVGRLTKDPEVKYTTGDEPMCVAHYTLAVQRNYKNSNGEYEADFIRCCALGKNGEYAEKYLKQGMKIAVVGNIRTGSYKDKDGNTKYITEVVVSEHEFCESKSNGSSGQTFDNGNNDFVDADDTSGSGLPFNF